MPSPRTPVREQPPHIRRTNFDEVCLGYNEAEALQEASRCIQCKKPMCVTQCPVSLKIPQFINEIKQSHFANAACIMAQDSSLPAVCGRVCPQESQCEGRCVLGIKGEAVAIGKLERFAADWAADHAVLPFTKQPFNGKRIAIVGSGPAGLSCAADLAKTGCYVKVFEALHKPGGVLEYGIPEFRLPKVKVVQHEIDNVRQWGVEIETNVIVGRSVTIDQLLHSEKFDAVFIASGAGLPKFMHIEGEHLNGVISANEFLTRANLMKAGNEGYDTPIYTGKKIAVVGGGNVAMDAARTALRLGAQVDIVYRRSEQELPARVEEVHHARQEGVVFNMLVNPVGILGTEQGWVESMRCVRMELGQPDGSGRRSPIPIAGCPEFNIAADVVIMALGTAPNPLIKDTTHGLESDKYGCIIADGQGATPRQGVFAGGDAVSGAATVVLAIGAGRTSAQAIYRYVMQK